MVKLTILLFSILKFPKLFHDFLCHFFKCHYFNVTCIHITPKSINMNNSTKLLPRVLALALIEGDTINRHQAAIFQFSRSISDDFCNVASRDDIPDRLGY